MSGKNNGLNSLRGRDLDLEATNLTGIPVLPETSACERMDTQGLPYTPEDVYMARENVKARIASLPAKERKELFPED